MYDLVVKKLEEIGVTIDEMANELYDLQKKYIENLRKETCIQNIEAILKKREAQYAILTGLEIDRLTEEGHISSPLREIIFNDEGRYGIDEILALAITNIYGSIGLTNFGYLDKVKPGIIGKLDNKKSGSCRTFADDLVSAIIAAGASRLAHGTDY